MLLSIDVYLSLYNNVKILIFPKYIYTKKEKGLIYKIRSSLNQINFQSINMKVLKLADFVSAKRVMTVNVLFK